MYNRYRAPLGYAAFGLILFAGFLFATFPYSATLSKVLAPMGFQFSSASQEINFPFGAQLTGVRVNSLTSAASGPMIAREPIIECPVMSIAPSILSLLTFQPGARLKASLYDGIARATIRPSGGGTAISYDLDALNIAEQHLFALPVASASGTISGHRQLWLSPADLATDTGIRAMNGARLTITSDYLTAPIRAAN